MSSNALYIAAASPSPQRCPSRPVSAGLRRASSPAPSLECREDVSLASQPVIGMAPYDVHQRFITRSLLSYEESADVGEARTEAREKWCAESLFNAPPMPPSSSRFTASCATHLKVIPINSAYVLTSVVRRTSTSSPRIGLLQLEPLLPAPSAKGDGNTFSSAAAPSVTLPFPAVTGWVRDYTAKAMAAALRHLVHAMGRSSTDWLLHPPPPPSSRGEHEAREESYASSRRSSVSLSMMMSSPVAAAGESEPLDGDRLIAETTRSCAVLQQPHDEQLEADAVAAQNGFLRAQSELSHRLLVADGTVTHAIYAVEVKVGGADVEMEPTLSSSSQPRIRVLSREAYFRNASTDDLPTAKHLSSPSERSSHRVRSEDKGDTENESETIPEQPFQMEQGGQMRYQPVIGSGIPGFRDGIFTQCQFHTPTALCWRTHTSSFPQGMEDSTAPLFSLPLKDAAAALEAGEPVVTTDLKVSLTAFLKRVAPSGSSAACSQLFISDTGNHAIRLADFRTQLVRTVLGLHRIPGYRDGGVHAALLSAATSMVYSSRGLVFTDGANGAVRLLSGAVPEELSLPTPSPEANASEISQKTEKSAVLQPQLESPTEILLKEEPELELLLNELQSIASGTRRKQTMKKKKAKESEAPQSTELNPEEPGNTFHRTTIHSPMSTTAAALRSAADSLEQLLSAAPNNSSDDATGQGSTPLISTPQSPQSAVKPNGVATAAAVTNKLKGIQQPPPPTPTPEAPQRDFLDGLRVWTLAGGGAVEQEGAAYLPISPDVAVADVQKFCSSAGVCYMDAPQRANCARFGYLSDMVYIPDSSGGEAGALFLCDTTNHAVRVLTREGVHSVVGPLDFPPDMKKGLSPLHAPVQLLALSLNRRRGVHRPSSHRQPSSSSSSAAPATVYSTYMALLVVNGSETRTGVNAEPALDGMAEDPPRTGDPFAEREFHRFTRTQKRTSPCFSRQQRSFGAHEKKQWSPIASELDSSSPFACNGGLRATLLLPVTDTFMEHVCQSIKFKRTLRKPITAEGDESIHKKTTLQEEEEEEEEEIAQAMAKMVQLGVESTATGRRVLGELLVPSIEVVPMKPKRTQRQKDETAQDTGALASSYYYLDQQRHLRYWFPWIFPPVPVVPALDDTLGSPYLHLGGPVVRRTRTRASTSPSSTGRGTEEIRTPPLSETPVRYPLTPPRTPDSAGASGSPVRNGCRPSSNAAADVSPPPHRSRSVLSSSSASRPELLGCGADFPRAHLEVWQGNLTSGAHEEKPLRLDGGREERSCSAPPECRSYTASPERPPSSKPERKKQHRLDEGSVPSHLTAHPTYPGDIVLSDELSGTMGSAKGATMSGDGLQRHSGVTLEDLVEGHSTPTPQRHHSYSPGDPTEDSAMPPSPSCSSSNTSFSTASRVVVAPSPRGATVSRTSEPTEEAASSGGFEETERAEERLHRENLFAVQPPWLHDHPTRKDRPNPNRSSSSTASTRSEERRGAALEEVVEGEELSLSWPSHPPTRRHSYRATSSPTEADTFTADGSVYPLTLSVQILEDNSEAAAQPLGASLLSSITRAAAGRASGSPWFAPSSPLAGGSSCASSLASRHTVSLHYPQQWPSVAATPLQYIQPSRLSLTVIDSSCHRTRRPTDTAERQETESERPSTTPLPSTATSTRDPKKTMAQQQQREAPQKTVTASREEGNTTDPSLTALARLKDIYHRFATPSVPSERRSKSSKTPVASSGVGEEMSLIGLWYYLYLTRYLEAPVALSHCFAGVAYEVQHVHTDEPFQLNSPAFRKDEEDFGGNKSKNFSSRSTPKISTTRSAPPSCTGFPSPQWSSFHVWSSPTHSVSSPSTTSRVVGSMAPPSSFPVDPRLVLHHLYRRSVQERGYHVYAALEFESFVHLLCIMTLWEEKCLVRLGEREGEGSHPISSRRPLLQMRSSFSQDAQRAQSVERGSRAAREACARRGAHGRPPQPQRSESWLCVRHLFPPLHDEEDETMEEAGKGITTPQSARTTRKPSGHLQTSFPLTSSPPPPEKCGAVPSNWFDLFAPSQLEMTVAEAEEARAGPPPASRSALLRSDPSASANSSSSPSLLNCATRGCRTRYGKEVAQRWRHYLSQGGVWHVLQEEVLQQEAIFLAEQRHTMEVLLRRLTAPVPESSAQSGSEWHEKSLLRDAVQRVEARLLVFPTEAEGLHTAEGAALQVCDATTAESSKSEVQYDTKRCIATVPHRRRSDIEKDRRVRDIFERLLRHERGLWDLFEAFSTATAADAGTVSDPLIPRPTSGGVLSSRSVNEISSSQKSTVASLPKKTDTEVDVPVTAVSKEAWRTSRSSSSLTSTLRVLTWSEFLNLWRATGLFPSFVNYRELSLLFKEAARVPLLIPPESYRPAPESRRSPASTLRSGSDVPFEVWRDWGVEGSATAPSSTGDQRRSEAERSCGEVLYFIPFVESVVRLALHLFHGTKPPNSPSSGAAPPQEPLHSSETTTRKRAVKDGKEAPPSSTCSSIGKKDSWKSQVEQPHTAAEKLDDFCRLLNALLKRTAEELASPSGGLAGVPSGSAAAGGRSLSGGWHTHSTTGQDLSTRARLLHLMEHWKGFRL